MNATAITVNVRSRSCAHSSPPGHILPGMPPEHPGDNWPQFCPRSPNRPVLPLSIGRSILSRWPPRAVCEVCASPRDDGYAGPAQGNVITYPDPTIRYQCEKCARESLSLQDDELTGHLCGEGCTDTDHVELRIMLRGFGERGEAARFEEVAPELAARGWTVTAIVPAVGRRAVRTIGGEPWDVWFQATRELRTL